MKKPTTPKQIEVISLDRKVIGAIMLDHKGYFYRPKKSTIGKGGHDPKWDGEHFPSIQELKLTLY